MKFYEVGPRQDFAGYWPERVDGEVGDARIPAHSRKKEGVVNEYFGDPPTKPKKLGSFHKSAYGFFVRDDALEQFQRAARGNLITNPTTVVGRESEVFYQVWITNYVDCLDLAQTVASPSSGKAAGKIGVIKRPVFDEKRWDGSDLFVVPQDPSFCLFCSEQFVVDWQAAKKKGVVFRRFLMDPEAIRA